MARLDPDKETPRRFVGDMITRLIHRTDSEDEACSIDLDDSERTDRLAYGDSLAHLLGQEWSAFVKVEGPLLEGETPEMYNLPANATTRKHWREVKRSFRPCPTCRPDQEGPRDGAASE